MLDKEYAIKCTDLRSWYIPNARSPPQLSLTTTALPHPPPPPCVPTQGKRAVQVISGRYHTLAVTDSGEVYSWGLNDHGQLGRVAVGKAGEHDPTPCHSGPSCHDGQPRALQGLEGEGPQVQGKVHHSGLTNDMPCTF